MTQEMIAPEDGNTAQQRRDQEVYQSWLKKDRCACFTMLSSMHNDLIDEFEEHATTRVMRDVLKLKFCGTSATRLHDLNIKFDSYKMRLNHIMK